MDDEEVYILMCEKATKIQEDHDLDLFDIVKVPEYLTPIIVGINHLSHYINGCNGLLINIDKCVWLPTLEQLQKMVGINKLDSKWIAWLRFLVDLSWVINDYPMTFNSMKQLGLAFVMWEKYKEKWNGEDWIKEE